MYRGYRSASGAPGWVRTKRKAQVSADGPLSLSRERGLHGATVLRYPRLWEHANARAPVLLILDLRGGSESPQRVVCSGGRRGLRAVFTLAKCFEKTETSGKSAA